MRAIILVAGVASRLRPLTDAVPKCLLPVAGVPILERILHALTAHGVSDVLLVTGYRGRQVENFVAERFLSLSTTFIRNHDYERTNNIASLHLARAWGDGREFLLLDGDILFDRRAIALMLAAGPESALLLRSRGEIGEEEIKVQLDGEGYVRRIGKEIPASTAAGESIGIERFAPDEGRMLFTEVEELVVRQGRSDLFYEAAFQRGIDRGMALRAVNIGDLPCMEIDTPEDLVRGERDVAPDLLP